MNSVVKTLSEYKIIFSIAFLSILTAFLLKPGIMPAMGFFLGALAILKILNLNGFTKGFQKYDIIAKRFPIYAAAYPLIELTIAICLIGSTYLNIISIPTIIIGAIGSYSVYKTVYIQKKKFNCACVGSIFNVPLGPVSLIENLAMTLMGVACFFA